MDDAGLGSSSGDAGFIVMEVAAWPKELYAETNKYASNGSI